LLAGGGNRAISTAVASLKNQILAKQACSQPLAGTPGEPQSLNDYVQARLAYEFKSYAEAERLIRQAITEV
jgi:hypothetical protein